MFYFFSFNYLGVLSVIGTTLNHFELSCETL